MFSAADYLHYWQRRMLFFSKEQSIFLRNPSLRVVVLIYRKKLTKVKWKTPKEDNAVFIFLR